MGHPLNRDAERQASARVQSDDIDRLKTVLEGLAQANDELKDIHDAMRDVVNAVKPVELETDPEGHGALRDIARDINLAWLQTRQRVEEIAAPIVQLCGKARTTC